MLKPRSLQSEYSLIWSLDPALQLPDDDEEKANALRVARETGKWQDLIRQGESPTLFQVRPVPGSSISWWLGEVQRENLTTLESCELALRLALRGVTNFGDAKVTTLVHEGHVMATRDIIDALYRIGENGDAGRAVVMELGGIVIQHGLDGIGPLS